MGFPVDGLTRPFLQGVQVALALALADGADRRPPLSTPSRGPPRLAFRRPRGYDRESPPMNPLLAWIVSHSTGRALSRRCVRCGRAQIVAREKAGETVACARCGGPVPPPPTPPR